MNIKRHIPNALTCCNLLCGCFGILFTVNYRLDGAFCFVLLAAVFDFLDGFVARLLKVSSPIGKDLDSLADMVTFGVLPGFIMYRMLVIAVLTQTGMPTVEMAGLAIPARHLDLAPSMMYIPLISFTIPVFSALRLAKFNNDTRQSDSFIGVNTPANTLLISSLGLIMISHATGPFRFMSPSTALMFDPLRDLLHNVYVLIALTLLMSFLLVSELSIFALKFKNFSWTDNKIRYAFLIIAVVLLILFQFYAFPFIIFLYILLSIIHNIITKKEKINS